MTNYHLLGQLVQTKERECEPLIVYLEGYVTFSFVSNKSSIISLNSLPAWKLFHFIFRVQAVVAVIRYDTPAPQQNPIEPYDS